VSEFSSLESFPRMNHRRDKNKKPVWKIFLGSILQRRRCENLQRNKAVNSKVEGLALAVLSCENLQSSW
jgi:hypothetical protein